MGGRIRVRVLDANGKVVPGFSFDECEPITGDGLALPVRWKKPLSEMKVNNVRLEFEITNAKLFAFRAS
jgi:hypothetical protein